MTDRELMQQALEPVAWMSPGRERLEFSRKDTVYGSHTIPLYTSPPQRKPLTEEEIEDLYFDCFSMGELKAFARAVERAHGIGEKE